MKNGSTRREFALAAAAAAAIVHPASADTDVRDMKHSEDLDPVKWTHDRYQSAPLRLTFRATTRYRQPW